MGFLVDVIVFGLYVFGALWVLMSLFFLAVFLFDKWPRRGGAQK